MPTSSQIAAIQAAYQQMLISHDPEGYYAALSDAGIYYGNLALGVVRDDTFFGAFANNFAKNKIDGDLGLNSFTTMRGELMYQLAVRDYSNRSQSIDWQLSGNIISDYHDDAFATVFGISQAAEAWTPYYEVRALDDFQSWLPTSALDPSPYLDYVRMHVPLNSSEPIAHAFAVQWFQDIEYFLIDFVDVKFIWGDDVIGETIKEYRGANLTTRETKLLAADTYDPTSETDISGFLGYGIRTLFMNEMLQKTSGLTPAEVIQINASNSIISFQTAGLSYANFSLSDVVSHTLSTVNGLSAQSYAQDWFHSDVSTVIEALYGTNLYSSTNLTSANLILQDDTVVSNESHSFNVMRGDVNNATLNGSSQSILVGNDQDNVLVVTDTNEAVVYGGDGDDRIEISGVNDYTGWLVKTIIVDTGAGDDTIVFNDDTLNGLFSLVTVMSENGGHDVIENNGKKVDVANPDSDYAWHLNYILLDGLETSDLVIQKTLVDQRATEQTVETTDFRTTLNTDWWDVHYVLGTTDGTTSLDLGTFSFSKSVITSIGLTEGHVDSELDLGLSGWVNDVWLDDDASYHATRLHGFGNAGVLSVENDTVQVAMLGALVDMGLDSIIGA
jgi:hypothetical protein